MRFIGLTPVLAFLALVAISGCGGGGGGSTAPTGGGGIAAFSTPPGATLSLDGHPTGHVTPDTLANVAAGSHTLGLALATFRDTTAAVSVAEGGITTLNVALTSTPGPGLWSLLSAGATAPSGGLFFLDTLHGWGVDQPDVVYRTSDGGAIWLSTTIQHSGVWSNTIHGLRFFDVMTGYLVARDDYFGRAHLYWTYDGGITWSESGFSQGSTLLAAAYQSATRGWLLYWKQGYAYPPNDSLVLLFDDGGQYTGRWGEVYTESAVLAELWVPDVTRGALYWRTAPAAQHPGAFGFSTSNGWATATPISTGFLFDTAYLFLDPDHVWVIQGKTVGGAGTAFSAPDSLFALAFPTPQAGWVVGAHGSIYHTTDGGLNWTSQSSGVSTVTLSDVTFLDEHHGWAVGGGGVVLRYH